MADITARVEAEAALSASASAERQAFLLKLSDALRAEPDADAVANRALRMLFDHLRLDRCYIASYRPADDAADFPYQLGNDTVPPLPAEVRLSDFPDAYEQIRDRTFVIEDECARRGLTEAERASSNALGMRAMVATTARKGDKNPLRSLVAVSSRPRQWTRAEIALIEEAAERTWAAMERARAEAALHDSEESYRTLFETMGQGYCDLELIRDAEGRAVDQRYLELNPAFERLFGVPAADAKGRKASDVFPTLDPSWHEAFGHVAETGAPQRIERQFGARWFEVFAYSRGGDRLTVLYEDSTERKRAEIALRESEERLRQFGEASSDVLWIRDAETLQWAYLTPAFETIYGLDRGAALAGDNMTGWLDLIVPEDRQAALDNIQRVRAGGRAAFEYRIRRPSDGQVRWLRNTDFPMRDAAGPVRWLGGVGRDITEEKAATQRQEVLVNELQHRARNLLGVVTAVAGRTLRQGGSVDAFEERLQALSRAQGLLSQAGSDTVEVGALVRAELAAHVQDGSDRVRTGGPRVQLTARQVQNFALALHELTTNAVKYGALRGGAGRLAVTWEIVPDRCGRRRLALSWVESGVAVDLERGIRRGYGTELIQEALSYALEADVGYALGSDGVRCRIEMPVGRPE